MWTGKNDNAGSSQITEHTKADRTNTYFPPID